MDNRFCQRVVFVNQSFNQRRREETTFLKCTVTLKGTQVKWGKKIQQNVAAASTGPETKT
jgi:hypothetical protein